MKYFISWKRTYRLRQGHVGTIVYSGDVDIVVDCYLLHGVIFCRKHLWSRRDNILRPIWMLIENVTGHAIRFKGRSDLLSLDGALACSWLDFVDAWPLHPKIWICNGRAFVADVSKIQYVIGIICFNIWKCLSERKLFSRTCFNRYLFFNFPLNLRTLIIIFLLDFVTSILLIVMLLFGLILGKDAFTVSFFLAKVSSTHIYSNWRIWLLIDIIRFWVLSALLTFLCPIVLNHLIVFLIFFDDLLKWRHLNIRIDNQLVFKNLKMALT